MSKGRNWTAEEKAKIVVQGLKGRRVAEICNEYQIHQTQYYKWREQFLEKIPKVFETKAQSKQEERLERVNQTSLHRLRQSEGQCRYRAVDSHHQGRTLLVAGMVVGGRPASCGGKVCRVF